MAVATDRKIRHRAIPIPAMSLRGIHWGRAIGFGVVAPLCATAAWVAVVLCYSAVLAATLHGASDGGRVREFGTQGAWAVPVLNLTLTAVTASRVARQANTRTLAHGVVVGGVSGLVGLVVWVAYHGTPGAWAPVAVALTVATGWLGGRAANGYVAAQESLHRSGRAIAAATNPQEIVTAIGTHLPGPPVDAVALWRMVAEDSAGEPDELVLRAAWVTHGTYPVAPGARLHASELPILRTLRRDAPLFLRTGQLPNAKRAVWEPFALRSAVLLPLIAPDGAWLGVLLLASTARRGLMRETAGAYLTVAAQVALVLENLRLVEQGRQLGVVAERQRLAREIHDAVKQQAFAAEMQIAAARALFERDPVSAKTRLAQADTLIRGVQDELANVIHELRPVAFTGKGLAAGLREYADEWSRQHDIAAQVHTQLEDTPSPDVEQAVFRVAQEALANVARHSHATIVTVQVIGANDTMTLWVGDNGCGFVPAAAMGKGYGFVSMRERMATLGGRVEIASEPGGGTHVVCVCPSHRHGIEGESAGWASA